MILYSIDTMNEKLISLKNLSFRYGKDIVLKNVNLDICSKKNVAVIGRNGGGKSTLVKLILGFLKKSEGEIIYHIEKNEIGYLPQIREFDSSFPINIFDLVISGLSDRKNIFRKYSQPEKERAFHLMKEFDILHLQNKLISEVSGGQLQRALIARAVISSPRIIFLDETESFLDKEFGFRLFDRIRELSDSTLVVISHELDNFYDYVDSIFVVEGDVEVYSNKEDFLKDRHSFRHIHKH